MDSNSQTSQELLIPNDVSRSNFLFFMLLVFSHLNDEKKKTTGNQRSSHMFAAQEQVTADAGAEAATAKTTLQKETGDMLATY